VNTVDMGILDFSAQCKGMSAVAAVSDTVSLARRCDELGYGRFWIAEHHDEDSSERSPEVLLATIAGLTKRIKVGSGGILLRYKDPYLVAQAFSLMSALYPGRIELGIARGMVGTSLDEYFSYIDPSTANLDEKFRQLVSFFRSPLGAHVLRPGTTVDSVWMMGGRGALGAAGANASSFCLDCLFQSVSDEIVREIHSRYVESFRSRSVSREPEFAVAFSGICADTEEDAEAALKQASGTGFPLKMMANVIAGSPSKWQEHLHNAQCKWCTNKIIVVVASYDPKVRHRTVELLADCLGLKERENALPTMAQGDWIEQEGSVEPRQSVEERLGA
jgi:luciferase family oxidoreductase group 1